MAKINPEEAILAQVKIELDCWSRGDTEGYGQFAADDVTYFHNAPAGSRIDGKKAFQEFLLKLKGQIPPHNYKIVDPKVRVYGNVGIYSLIYHALSPDGKLIASGRGTIVYRHIDDRWEMLHTHWSVLDES